MVLNTYREKDLPELIRQSSNGKAVAVCRFCMKLVEGPETAEHWRTCKEHPANARIAALEQQVAGLEKERDAAQYVECDCCNGCGEVQPGCDCQKCHGYGRIMAKDKLAAANAKIADLESRLRSQVVVGGPGVVLPAGWYAERRQGRNEYTGIAHSTGGFSTQHWLDYIRLPDSLPTSSTPPATDPAFPTAFSKQVAEVYAERGDSPDRTAPQAESGTDRIIGRPDKPFHKPECRCADCIQWINNNPPQAESEKGKRLEEWRGRLSSEVANDFSGAWTHRTTIRCLADLCDILAEREGT